MVKELQGKLEREEPFSALKEGRCGMGSKAFSVPGSSTWCQSTEMARTGCLPSGVCSILVGEGELVGVAAAVS